MGIYTRKGDKGETGLLGGSRIGKDSLKVSCYGTLDEANAALGVAYSLITDKEIKEILHGIQQQLFQVGAELASDEKGKIYLKEPIQQSDIAAFEQLIDKYEAQLGPLKQFIIPGETTASANLHLARTIIRRAERQIVELAREEPVRQELIQYVNRLSDLIFMLARLEVKSSLVAKVKEKVLQKLASSQKPSNKLTLEMASQLAACAEAKARSIGVPVVFSAVDEGGNLILLHRMEGALLGSVDIAPNKAFTAVAFKMATHEVFPLIQPGAALYGLQMTNHNRVVTFGGGYPLSIDGEIVGAIGVSGGTVEEDMAIATEAVRMWERK